MLDTCSLRITDVAVEMEGKSVAGYKRIQRFLTVAPPPDGPVAFFQEDAAYMIGDPTETEHPQLGK